MSSLALMNFETLLRAAEFIDRPKNTFRESEHGYASLMPENLSYHKKFKHCKKFTINRSAHNELEKNRRADLRYLLDKLKHLVPLDSDCSKHTTLGLLRKARSFIKTLEETRLRNLEQQTQAKQRRNFLLQRQEQLSEPSTKYRTRIDRSISECSSRSTLSNISSSSSELDDIDIIGEESSASDMDDGYGSNHSIFCRNNNYVDAYSRSL